MRGVRPVQLSIRSNLFCSLTRSQFANIIAQPLEALMRIRSLLRLLLSLFAVPLLSGLLCAANQDRVIHIFTSSSTDGVSPNGGLIADPNGNLYGTTYEGRNLRFRYSL
jgi:hypothetical protein